MGQYGDETTMIGSSVGAVLQLLTKAVRVRGFQVHFIAVMNVMA